MLHAHQGLCQLFQKRRKKILRDENSKDWKEDSKLTSTKVGRNVITEASKFLKDDLLHGLGDADITHIKYHINTCYIHYLKKKER